MVTEEYRIDQYAPGRWLYRDWKVHAQVNDLFHCFRIRPGDWFTANSLFSACKTIDRRETERLNNPQSIADMVDNRRARLQAYKLKKKKEIENK